MTFKVGRGGKFQIHRNYSESGSVSDEFMVLFMVLEEKHAGTLTVGFKCQAKAVALIRSIRDKVNEEMIVGSLEEGWRT